MKLLPFQEPLLPEIIRQLSTKRLSINASDTGTGKTYLTLAAINQRRKPVLVVGPRAVLPMWEEVLAAHAPGIPVLGVLNIERLRTGRTPFLQRIPPVRKGSKPTFRWTVRDPSVIVMEEAHTCSGADSQNAFILAYLKSTPHEVMALSATLADSPAKLRALGYLMGLHNFVDFRAWAIAHGCYADRYGNLRYAGPVGGKDILLDLHKKIYPEFGVRLRIAEIPDFPKNFVDVLLIPDETTPADKKRHESRYPEVFSDLADAETETFMDDILANPKTHKEIPDIVRFLRSRQRAELSKTPWAADKICDLLEEGVSVVSFWNFKAPIYETREILLKRGVPSGIISGDTTDREETKNAFQRNETTCLFATHGAGGVGISLHDLNGRPRVSLISPPLAALPFTQALGRIHRSGALSPARQYVFCAANTAEEQVKRSLNKKMANLSLLQDGDFTPEL